MGEDVGGGRGYGSVRGGTGNIFCVATLSLYKNAAVLSSKVPR